MKTVKLSSLVEITNGYAFKSSNYVEDGVRVIRITNVQKGVIEDDNPKFYSLRTSDQLRKYLINKNDILMSLTGNVGRVGIFPSDLLPAYINQRICRIKPKNNSLHYKYLFYILNSDSFEFDAMNNSSGIAQLNLSTKWVEDYHIPLPPLETQKKIATILDKADELRCNDQNILEKYNQLAQSVFLEMFGNPVTNPKGYNIVKLDDISSKVTDGVHAKPEYTERGIPFISVKDITTGKLIFDNCKFISQVNHNKYIKRCKPEYLDILYTKVGATYGRPAIIDIEKEFSIYVSVALIKPKKEIINPYYLKEALANPALKRQADKSIKGIGVPDLHLNMIKEFILPLPKMELQNRFAKIIKHIETPKRLTQQSLQKSEELFQSLLQRAFKGELG